MVDTYDNVIENYPRQTLAIIGVAVFALAFWGFSFMQDVPHRHVTSIEIISLSQDELAEHKDQVVQTYGFVSAEETDDQGLAHFRLYSTPDLVGPSIALTQVIDDCCIPAVRALAAPGLTSASLSITGTVVFDDSVDQGVYLIEVEEMKEIPILK